MDRNDMRRQGVLAALGIGESDVELAKADIVARIHRVIESRRCSPDELAAVLAVTPSELPTLLQGRLATSSLDQLLRTLTWLGDGVEILIWAHVQRTKRGALRVFQASAVEKGAGSRAAPSF